MMYLTIAVGWIIAAGLTLFACRIAAAGDGDRSSELGLRKSLRLPPGDIEE